MVIFGPQDPLSGVWSTLQQPFELAAWVFLIAVLAFLFALTFLNYMLFWKKCTFSNYVRNLLGEEPNDLETDVEWSSDELSWRKELHEESLLAHRVATVSLRVAVAAFFAITILFYEVAIVLKQKRKTLGKDVQGLTTSEFSRYLVVSDSAQETIWRKNVDINGRFANRSIPWHKCRTMDECYGKLMDKNYPADYFVTYDLDVRYRVLNRTLRERLTIYTTQRPLFSFNWGWYYGANVPLDTRVRIDRGISTLRLEDKLRLILSEELDTSEMFGCGTERNSIGVAILGPMIAIFVGVFILILLAAGVRGYQIRRKGAMGYQREIQSVAC